MAIVISSYDLLISVVDSGGPIGRCCNPSVGLCTVIIRVHDDYSKVFICWFDGDCITVTLDGLLLTN